MDIAIILEKKWAIPAAVGVVSLGIGVGAGYILGKRKGFSDGIDATIAEFKYQEKNEQLTLLDEDNGILYLESYSIPEDLHIEVDPEIEYVNSIKAGDEVNIVVNQRNDPSKIVILGYDPEDDVEEELVVINVFDNPLADWNYELELSQRSPDKPYIIHRDEFLEDEDGYRQETLTYYEGDDILTDSADTPVYNFKQIVGAELSFGHGSGDPNVLYIRNEQMDMEWEILRHHGRYEVEVLGFQIESEYEKNDLKHGNGGKFRSED